MFDYVLRSWPIFEVGVYSVALLFLFKRIGRKVFFESFKLKFQTCFCDDFFVFVFVDCLFFCRLFYCLCLLFKLFPFLVLCISDFYVIVSRLVFSWHFHCFVLVFEAPLYLVLCGCRNFLFCFCLFFKFSSFLVLCISEFFVIVGCLVFGWHFHCFVLVFKVPLYLVLCGCHRFLFCCWSSLRLDFVLYFIIVVSLVPQLLIKEKRWCLF